MSTEDERSQECTNQLVVSASLEKNMLLRRPKKPLRFELRLAASSSANVLKPKLGIMTCSHPITTHYNPTSIDLSLHRNATKVGDSLSNLSGT